MGSGLGSPFGLEDKTPLFNLEGFTDSPHPHKLEIWTQYRLLFSFLGGYLLKCLGKGRLIRKGHEKSQACLWRILKVPSQNT